MFNSPVSEEIVPPGPATGARSTAAADHAHSAYRDTLVESRAGVNATVSTIRELGKLIKHLLDKGQSVYVILTAHPEIDLSENPFIPISKPVCLQKQAFPSTALI